MAKDNPPNAREIKLAPDAPESVPRQDDDLDVLLAKPMQQVGDQPIALTEKDDDSNKIEGIVIGRLVCLEGKNSGQMAADWPGNTNGGPLPVISTVSLRPEDEGRDVALAFEAGDPGKPIVVGLIHRDEIEVGAGSSEKAKEISGVSVERDGERLILTAQNEIVLRCGKSSITLTRAGKILIRGAYLLSRSSGVNRIKGGSVQIN
jgi:hypothetical protein